jgi:hypothetical protein
MQAIYKNGTCGPIEPYTGECLKERIQDPNVKHIEVFEATEENIKYRNRLLKVKKRFQKAPKIKKR